MPSVLSKVWYLGGGILCKNEEQFAIKYGCRKVKYNYQEPGQASLRKVALNPSSPTDVAVGRLDLRQVAACALGQLVSSLELLPWSEDPAASLPSVTRMGMDASGQVIPVALQSYLEDAKRKVNINLLFQIDNLIYDDF